MSLPDEGKWGRAVQDECFPSRDEEKHGVFRELWTHHLVLLV